MRGRWLSRALGIAAVLVAILLWEGVVRAGILDAAYFPPFSRVLQAFASEVRHPGLAADLFSTLASWLRGFVLATAAGVLIGVAVGTSEVAYSATRVIFEFMRPLPSAALVPVAILFLGIDTSMRTSVVFYSSFWPILFNTIYGIRSVERGYVDAARTFGLSRPEILFQVVVPGALPYINTGLRVGASIALVVAITSEMIAGAGGLGFYVSSMEMAMRTPEMYMGILLAGLLGFLLNALFLWAEHRFFKWLRVEGSP